MHCNAPPPGALRRDAASGKWEASLVVCAGASSEVHIFLARRAPGCGGAARRET